MSLLGSLTIDLELTIPTGQPEGCRAKGKPAGLGSGRDQVGARPILPMQSAELTNSSPYSAFKSSTNSSATDALLSERGHIDNSHRMADATLE